MICDYNGNLEYDERVLKVVDEITNYYKFISRKDALLVAALEPAIIDNNYDINLLRRLYYIMFINHNYDNIIYKDILNISSNNYYIVSAKILLSDYIEGKINFPSYDKIFTD